MGRKKDNQAALLLTGIAIGVVSSMMAQHLYEKYFSSRQTTLGSDTNI